MLDRRRCWVSLRISVLNQETAETRDPIWRRRGPLLITGIAIIGAKNPLVADLSDYMYNVTHARAFFNNNIPFWPLRVPEKLYPQSLSLSANGKLGLPTALSQAPNRDLKPNHALPQASSKALKNCKIVENPLLCFGSPFKALSSKP